MPGSAPLMRVQNRPVPAMKKGSALIAARMRTIAATRDCFRYDGSAIAAIAVAMARKGTPRVGMPQPSLPDGARDVLVLSGIYGYSHVETAEMLGIAEGTCKAQLHRARKLLAERLNVEIR